MKPRSDSILKLRALKSPEFGEKVIEWLHEPAQRDEATGKAIPRTGGAWYAIQQLAADGIKVSEPTLSEFYSWWQLRKTFQQADNLTNDFIELLKKEFPEVDSKKLQETGQAFFTMQAMANRDPEEYREMEKLRLAKETAETKGRQEEKKLQLAERRIVLLEEKIDKAKKTLSDPALTIEQREQRMKQMFGVA
jgi:hypothetical protein